MLSLCCARFYANSPRGTEALLIPVDLDPVVIDDVGVVDRLEYTQLVCYTPEKINRIQHPEQSDLIFRIVLFDKKPNNHTRQSHKTHVNPVTPMVWCKSILRYLHLELTGEYRVPIVQCQQ